MTIELEEFEPGRWRVRRERHEKQRAENMPLPFVISDTMEPVEQVDGRFYTSKRAFRAVGKANGLIEVGNEKPKPRVKLSQTRAAAKAAAPRSARRSSRSVRVSIEFKTRPDRSVKEGNYNVRPERCACAHPYPQVPVP